MKLFFRFHLPQTSQRALGKFLPLKKPPKIDSGQLIPPLFWTFLGGFWARKATVRMGFGNKIRMTLNQGVENLCLSLIWIWVLSKEFSETGLHKNCCACCQRPFLISSKVWKICKITFEHLVIILILPSCSNFTKNMVLTKFSPRNCLQRNWWHFTIWALWSLVSSIISVSFRRDWGTKLNLGVCFDWTRIWKQQQLQQ